MENKDLEIIRKLGVEVISNDRNYWLIRSQKGKYFEDFKEEGFVGIEWDKVSNLDIINNEHEVIKREVERQYPKLERPGYVASQILRFYKDIKIGDIVLVPSENSKWIAFGEVEGDMYLYEEEEEGFLLDFDNEEEEVLKKRRNVKWIKTIKRSEMDPYLRSIIYSHSAIVDLEKYSFFIDRTLSQFYVKNNEAFFTYKINKKENIPYLDMLEFLNNNKNLIDFLNKKLNLEINNEDIILKINVQSKGPVQLKGAFIKVLIAGLVISAIFGSKFDIEGFGVKFSIDTPGLPGLIKQVESLISTDDNGKIKDLELAEIKKNFDESKNKLDIKAPELKNENIDR
ncbi:hypothetical protein [Clostridium thermobutyricum]|uniref:hypothetical protein n=1 Tax=Clostridium thermobutyricum TaxID=29372 RepID=UPI0018AAD49D|nr:hypothetical protein [Clostridium thermobutyricum]